MEAKGRFAEYTRVEVALVLVERSNLGHLLLSQVEVENSHVFSEPFYFFSFGHHTAASLDGPPQANLAWSLTVLLGH